MQAYHRELLEHMPPPRPLRPPRIIVHQQPSIRAVPTLHREVGRRLPSRRGRDRRSGSRRRRKVVASSRDTNIS